MVDHVLPHQLVRQEVDIVVVDRLDDFIHVGGGDADVAQGFHFGGGVDVADEGVIGIFFSQAAHVTGVDAIGQGTAAVGIGIEHGFVRAQHFRGFRHETHRRENDHLGGRLSGNFGQAVGIARVVGDAIKNLRRHVIVRQDDRVLFFFECFDALDGGQELVAMLAAEFAQWASHPDGP